MLADCHPFQRAAVETPYRHISLLVGRGGGKTTTMRARNIRKLSSIRRAQCIYFAKVRDQARTLMWEPLKLSLEAYEARLGNKLDESWSFSEFRLVATCKRTGSTLRLLGMDDQAEIEKLRGQPFDNIDVDECASHKPELLQNLIKRIIGPRLGERKGCVVLGGTPGFILRGPFYDYSRPGASVKDEKDRVIPLHIPYRDVAAWEMENPWYFEEHPANLKKPGTVTAWDGYVSFAWTLKDVVDLPNADHYPALQNLWDETVLVKSRDRMSDDNPIWMREYLGIWAADDSGMVYRYRPATNQFDPFNAPEPLPGIQGLTVAIDHVKALFPEVKDWRFVIGADSGSSDPWACVVVMFSPQDQERRLWYVYSSERTGMYPKQFAELVIGEDAAKLAMNGQPIAKYGGLMGVTGWPDGMVLDGDQTTIDELAQVFGLRFTKSDRNPLAKMGAIELVNGDLLEGRIKVIRGSGLEQQLQQLQWEEDVHGNVKESKSQSNHQSDACLYSRKLVANMFASGIIESDAKPSASTFKDPMGLQSSPVDARDADRGEFSDFLSSAEWVDISL